MSSSAKNKPVPRNPYAEAAHRRKGGAHVSHKDLTGRRGGSRNETLDILSEYEEEMEFIEQEEELTEEEVKAIEEYSAYQDDLDFYNEMAYEKMERYTRETEDEEQREG